MGDLTIPQVLEKKRVLEGQVTNLLKAFEAETKVQLSSIQVNRLSAPSMNDPKASIISSVDTEAILR